MTASIYESPESVAVSLSYKHSAISDAQASAIGGYFDRILSCVLREECDLVGDMRALVRDDGLSHSLGA